MNRPSREQVVAIFALALAAGAFAWGVLAEQLGDTLFNATLV
jgi:nitrogen fixation-related uncharacterized protein